MQLVFIEVSKYILAFLLCFYAAAAYRGAERREAKVYICISECNNVYDTFIGLFDTLSA